VTNEQDTRHIANHVFGKGIFLGCRCLHYCAYNDVRHGVF